MDRLDLGPDEENKCKNLLERFIFSMKNMHMLTERPADFNDPLLVDLYSATELATMTVTTRQQYDNVMTNEIDRMCEVAYAKEQGRAEGLAEGRVEGRAEVARMMLDKGIQVSLISECTGLSADEIKALA